MRVKLKVSLCAEDGTRFFGYGVYQLLLGIRETGSLRAAAAEMDMAYSKAFRILKTAEEYFGFALTERKSGGIGGGGSVLTEKADALLVRYQALILERDALEGQLLERYYGDF